MCSRDWIQAQQTAPELWAELESGHLDEDTVELYIESELERVRHGNRN